VRQVERIRAWADLYTAAPWSPVLSPWMERGSRGLWSVLAALFLGGLLLRAGLIDTLDLRDLPGAAGADTISRAGRGEFSTWASWVIGLFLPWSDGDPVASARTVAQLSGAMMIAGATLGGLAVAGPAGALACSAVSVTWAVALLPVLLVGPDPPAIGLAWLGLGLAWVAPRTARVGPLITGLGSALIIAAVAVKSVALPALGLLPATLLLCRARREAAAHLGAMSLMTVLSWWVLSPDLQQHDGGLAPLSLTSLPSGLWEVVTLGETWPDGALPLFLLATVATGLWPGAAWARRGGIAGLTVLALSLTAAGLGSRLCPRLLLVSAFGSVICVGVLALLIGDRFRDTPVARWAPLGLAGMLLLMDSWAWVSAWDDERVRFSGAQSAQLPQAPAPWATRYAIYAEDPHSERLRDLTSAGATSLMAIPEGTAGVAIPPLRDRREQHLAVAAALEGVPILVLEEHHCCQYPTTMDCAARTIRELSESGIVLILPGESAQEGMTDSGSAWVSWLRDQALSGSTPETGSWWDVYRPQGVGAPMPCKPQYPQSEELSWPPPWPEGSQSRTEHKETPPN
jgi:hypothetical protein